MKLSPPQDLIPTPLPPARKECTYIGDVCSIHGKGAKLKWRLAKTKSLGPNGILRPDREYYRVCDVGIANIRLVQPSLPQSWTKKTLIRKTEDTRKTFSNTFVNSNVLSTPSMGQPGYDDAVEGAGIKDDRTS